MDHKRRICTNQQMNDLYKELDIISEIGKGRLQWSGHMERMPEERNAKKVSKNTPEGKRSIGNPLK
jgi:hypothetical protein